MIHIYIYSHIYIYIYESFDSNFQTLYPFTPTSVCILQEQEISLKYYNAIFNIKTLTNDYH